MAATWTYEKPSPVGDEPEFKRQIESWFNEVTSVGFRSQDVDPFAFNSKAGHYTQVGGLASTISSRPIPPIPVCTQNENRATDFQ